MYPTCFEAGECLPGLLECHGVPFPVPILFPPVGFSMQLLDRGHHPYISTGFDGNHFYSTFILVLNLYGRYAQDKFYGATII